MKARLPALCAAALVLSQALAHGTSFAVLLSPGLKGESTNPLFPGGIDIASFSLDGPLAVGTPGSLALHKRIDKSSPLLFRHCANGKHIAKAQLLLLDPPPPGSNSSPVFCTITLTDLLVSNYQCAAETQDSPPLEEFRLKFGRIFYDYRTADGLPFTAYLALAQTGPDSDNDGMSDAFEEYFGFDPAVPNGDQDSDNDGMSDRDEARLGFNPVAGDSFFRCSVAPVPGSPGLLDISWDAVPGMDYVIEWTPDLSQRFEPLATVPADSLRAGSAQVRGPLSGFFRVRPAADG